MTSFISYKSNPWKPQYHLTIHKRSWEEPLGGRNQMDLNGCYLVCCLIDIIHGFVICVIFLLILISNSINHDKENFSSKFYVLYLTFQIQYLKISITASLVQLFVVINSTTLISKANSKFVQN
jgi:hypothetical protein